MSKESRENLLISLSDDDEESSDEDDDYSVKIIEKRKEQIENFDFNFTKLVSTLFAAIKSKYGDNEIMLKNIESYQKLKFFLMMYRKTENPSEFFEYFSDIYEKYSFNILRTTPNKNDNWLKNFDITIIYNSEDNPEAAKKMAIELSVIYNIADELSKEAWKRVARKNTTETSKDNDLLRTSAIKTYLMRIFYYLCNNENEKSQLAKIVTDMEKDIGWELTLNNNEMIVRNNVNVDTNTGTGTFNNNGLSSVFKFAKNLMKQTGHDAPDLPEPSDDQISSMLNNVFSNPSTQNMMSGIFSAVANNTNNNNGEAPIDFNNLFGTIAQTVSDPALIKNFQNDVMKDMNKDK